MLEMKVSGLTCGHCVQTVTQAIQALDTHARVRVDLADGLVSAETAVDRASAVRAIEGAGYKVLPCTRD
ncbi:heavy-metal-associated domain-containing protein [Roseococcus sp. SDR]|nr:heavy-metal-associated domain-containing protein [Roseococcus sp. SDR]MBV1844856.1 heavy-metal-associated domain-containing protein [Roseococcus sp. SDR]